MHEHNPQKCRLIEQKKKNRKEKYSKKKPKSARRNNTQIGETNEE